MKFVVRWFARDLFSFFVGGSLQFLAGWRVDASIGIGFADATG
jgi:hypothetical protein